MLLVEGSEKIVTILLDVINQYGDLTGGQLVELTHSSRDRGILFSSIFKL